MEICLTTHPRIAEEMTSTDSITYYCGDMSYNSPSLLKCMADIVVLTKSVKRARGRGLFVSRDPVKPNAGGTVVSAGLDIAMEACM